MRFAIPLAEGKLTTHFGHCASFALLDVINNEPSTRTDVIPPPHEPGILPPWLASQGVTHIIAGGMGQRAMQLFAQAGVTVITGAPVDEPESLVKAYLANSLITGGNGCDH